MTRHLQRTLTPMFSPPLPENKRHFMLMASVFLCIACLEMASPIITGRMINQGILQSGQSTILHFTGLLLLLSLSIALLSHMQSRLFTRFEILMITHVQSTVMQRLFKLPLAFFDNYAVGELSHRMLMLKSLIRPFSPNQTSAFFSFIFAFISFSVMVYYAWESTLCISIVLAIFLWVTSWIVFLLLPHQEKNTDEMGHSYRFLFQVIHGILRIKLFAKEQRVQAAWDKIHSRAQSHLHQAYRLGIVRFTLFSNIQLVAMMALFFISRHQYNPLLTENFIIFFAAFTQFMSRFISFYLTTNELLPTIIAYKRLKPLLEAPIEITTPSSPFSLPTAFEGSIQIKDLHFKYPTSKTQIFTGLNCSILPGQHVAFVGLSGAGKSTLLKLLLGFYFAEQGDLCFDEQPIQQLDLLALRQQVGVVFQDSQLLNGSILDNIVGHVGASESDAWRVATQVGLHTWILSLPMGMHTAVSQHMHLISGGQKQLILIARALISTPRLLLLDEATNALDNKAQALVVQCIHQLKITRISIAHRLSTVTQADNIFVLHQGKIIESGRFAQLIQQKGLFYRLAQLQAPHQQGIVPNSM